MSDERQAEILAVWLDAAPGTVPPEDLDPEVLEGIYALRPDRAPPHRVRMDEILDTLVAGPLADPEVAEVAVALNPDLAPPHRVHIDEILDTVTQGPFAGPAEVVDLAAARKARRWWVGAGAFAAAALALFIVVPVSHKADQVPTHQEPSLKTAPASPEKTKRAAKKAKRAAKRSAEFEDLTRSPASARALKMPAQDPTPEKLAEESLDQQGGFGTKGKPASVGQAGLGANNSGHGGGGSASQGYGSGAGQAPPSRPASAAPAPVIADDAADEPAEEADLAQSEDKKMEPQVRRRLKRQAQRQAMADTPPPSAEPAPSTERSSAGTIDRAPADAREDFPETRTFANLISAAAKRKNTDPEAALAQVRRALQKYRKVHPNQLRLAYQLKAEILERLNRHKEAAEAKKKASQIESSD